MFIYTFLLNLIYFVHFEARTSIADELYLVFN
jgi:hypothetical protein